MAKQAKVVSFYWEFSLKHLKNPWFDGKKRHAAAPHVEARCEEDPLRSAGRLPAVVPTCCCADGDGNSINLNLHVSRASLATFVFDSGDDL